MQSLFIWESELGLKSRLPIAAPQHHTYRKLKESPFHAAQSVGTFHHGSHPNAITRLDTEVHITWVSRQPTTVLQLDLGGAVWPPCPLR